MAEDNIDKALPNEPRKEFNIPGEEEIREEVVEKLKQNKLHLDPLTFKRMKMVPLILI
jgi:hypothetical protein